MMKRFQHAKIALVCALGLTACASTVELSRKDMLQRLKPLLALEHKYGQLQQTVQLATYLFEDLADKKATEFKEHVDVYWIHHAAANVSIANGDLEVYEKHMEAAKEEVDAMEAVLGEWSQALFTDQGAESPNLPTDYKELGLAKNGTLEMIGTRTRSGER